MIVFSVLPSVSLAACELLPCSLSLSPGYVAQPGSNLLFNFFRYDAEAFINFDMSIQFFDDDDNDGEIEGNEYHFFEGHTNDDANSCFEEPNPPDPRLNEHFTCQGFINQLVLLWHGNSSFQIEGRMYKISVILHTNNDPLLDNPHTIQYDLVFRNPTMCDSNCENDISSRVVGGTIDSINSKILETEKHIQENISRYYNQTITNISMNANRTVDNASIMIDQNLSAFELNFTLIDADLFQKIRNHTSLRSNQFYGGFGPMVREMVLDNQTYTVNDGGGASGDSNASMYGMIASILLVTSFLFWRHKK